MPKIIYTTHAQERIRLRRLNGRSIEATLTHPDETQDLEDGKKKFIKLQGQRLYHVVAQYKSDQHAWLVISVWVRGEEDPPDYLWLIITSPFRLLWWLVKFIFRLLFGRN
ncbi:hypothetical protein IJJ08_03500 [bacterium]|nr:hypothetical protein [bacterium]